MKNTVLVTGATGFIGPHIVETLLKQGKKIRCLVRETSDVGFLKKLDIDYVYGDLLQPDSLLSALDDISEVYHLAAKVRPDKVFENRRKAVNSYFKVNALGTLNLLEACLNKRIDKFVHFSSISVAGPGIDLNENCSCRPVTEYGRSKLLAEEYVIKKVKEANFPAVILRPGIVYGRRSKGILSIVRFIKIGFLPIIGPALMPVCYIDDLIDAVFLAAKKAPAGSKYFIVEGSYRLSAFGQAIAEALNKSFVKLYIPKFISYFCVFLKSLLEILLNVKISPFCIEFNQKTISAASYDWTYDTFRARKELAFVPKQSLKGGMKRTLE